MSLGKLIKELRLKAGYDSLAELAEDCGINKSTLSRIEAGISKPTPETLNTLAPYLNVDPQQLMIAAGYMPDRSQQPTRLETNWPETVKILRRSSKKASPGHDKLIARIIKAALEDK